MTGAVETAEALALWGRATLTAAAEGEEVVAEVAQGLRFLKIGANVLLVVGLVAEAVLLIVDAVQGAEQMEKLQA